MRARGWWAICVAVVTALPPAAGAQSAPAPKLQAAVLSSVLSYDRNLHRHRHQKIVIAVVYKKTSATSIGAAAEMGAAFNAVARERLNGASVDITEVGFKDPAELEGLLRAANVYAIYVTKGLEEDLASVQAAAEKLKVTTLCSDREWARRYFSVAVVTQGAKPRLVINLSRAKAEGMDINSSVLSLAEVIR